MPNRQGAAHVMTKRSTRRGIAPSLSRHITARMTKQPLAMPPPLSAASSSAIPSIRAVQATAAADLLRPGVLKTPGPKMSNAASLAFIHPNLYLTSLTGAKCFEGAVAIVAAGGRETTDYLRSHRADYRAYVNVDDTPFMSYAHFAVAFSKSAALLKKALSTGRTTLLHCHMGINRSVATALAYVLMYTELDYETCLHQIREANALHRALPALTNITFQTHLRRFAAEAV